MWLLSLVLVLAVLGPSPATNHAGALPHADSFGSAGVAPVATEVLDAPSRAKILASYGRLPLSFESNHGQTDGQVRFLARGSDYTLFLTSAEAVLALRRPEVPAQSMSSDRRALPGGKQEDDVALKLTTWTSLSWRAPPKGSGSSRRNSYLTRGYGLA